MEFMQMIDDQDQLEPEAPPQKVFGRHDFVFLSDCAKCWIVRILDILTIESDQGYTKIALTSGTAILIRQALYKCESKLDPSIFFRTGRNSLVNLHYVKEVQIFDRKRYVFFMTNGKQTILSRQCSVRLRRQKSL